MITFFITGTVIMSVFNLSLKKQDKFASESYYEIEPEKELTEEEIKVLEALEKLNGSKAETNKAFNETSKNKHFAEAFKPIAPPEDYVPKSHSDSEDAESYTKKYEATNDSKVNQDEISSFSKVNDLLKKQQQSGANTKSTISFSLVDRDKIYIPIPVYLCEVDGKIVVNVTVNENGNVIDAYINTSSTSNNECLIEHALEYAKDSQFSKSPTKKKQLGTITFHFIGKH
ncbi:energy transducer TonB [Flavivirga sp. 57AJ16]|uniref:energy transducer TonB family protein n=1 Tax=Flavivirga sp. 57AJ16 TaxID=3025307 RepID=UPI002366CA00|nr:energy transducer TonB [Flavivirga sp. 57AJ16]MDD7884579.1 energy transducer TonB [Flavivirga sp. 57AJ16]